MKRTFALPFGLAIAFTLSVLAAPFAFAQSVPSSCLSATDQDTLSSSLQQLTQLAQTILVQNLPQSVLAADESLVTAIGQVILQITEACAPIQSADTGSSVPPSGSTTTPAPSGSAPTSATFPVTILVTSASLNVRSSPNTSAPLAGSQTLVAGNEFTATSEVVGESVNGNDLWWVSSQGNYVWSGGTTVAGSAGTTVGTTPTGSTPTTTGTPTSKVPTGKTLPSENTTVKTLADVTGLTYSVTYSYLPDGEVQASFVYKGQSLVVAFGQGGAQAQVASVQSNGSLKPYAWLSDLTLTKLIGVTITNSLPANQTVFFGYTFSTPLYYTTDVSPNYVDNPANAYYITNAPISSITPGLYYLTTDANGNITAIQEIFISSQTGAVTEGAVISLAQPAPTLTSILPKISDSELQSEIAAVSFDDAVTIATNANYLVYVSDNGAGEVSAIIRDPLTNAVVAAISEQDD